LAEAAPRAFIDQLWPWLTRILTHIESDRELWTAFKKSWSLAIGLDPGDVTHREHPLAASFDVAVRSYAQQSPDGFLTFLSRESGCNSNLVQRLLCRGLGTIATSHPGAGLEFLKGDTRRFRLGSLHDEYADTRTLIAAIVPRLTVGQRSELEEAILSCRLFAEDVGSEEPELRFKASKWNREHRLRLLKAFPEGTLTPRTQSIVDAEILALPHYQDPEVRFGSYEIHSPMSAEQMARAKDEHITNLFEELVDQTHDNHPRDHLRGGSAQASQEFGRFARENPERAVSIIRGFEPGRQERPIAIALRDLAKTDFPDEELFDLITELDGRGFGSEEFRTCAAMALRERLRNGRGLPDWICDLLEKWRTGPWTLGEAVQRVRRGEEEGEEKPKSVLWKTGRIVTVPGGSYNVLHTLTYAYLLRRPPLADRWLTMLRDHLRRPERSAVWHLLAPDLRYLTLCGRDAATDFVQELFVRYQDVRDSDFGAGLITYLWTFLPDAVVDSFLAAIRDGSWPDGPQAYGELLALRALVFPEKQAVRRELERWLRRSTARQEKAARIRLGISYAATYSWSQPGKRGDANGLLLELIPFAIETPNRWIRLLRRLAEGLPSNGLLGPFRAWCISHLSRGDNRQSRAKPEHLADAIMAVFWICDDLPADDHTWSLLEQILSHPQILERTGDDFLVEHLEHLLPMRPELVFRLCRELIQRRGRELISIQTSFAMSAPHLTTIALALQRLGGAQRGQGLELFEQLLALGVPDAQSTLNELDQRPIVIPASISLRRRRRVGSSQ
jgi:hypothetical protein